MHGLVVDDSKIIRKITVRMLANLGISATEAENGAEAYDHFMSQHSDFILLDWNMPIEDGLSFLKRLRATDLPVQPKVIFVTSETEFEKIGQALSAGADEYVMKPFDEDVLASKLKLVGVI